MNSLIANKLHRLKGEPVEEIIDSDGIILNDDQAEAALQFELSKIDAFQKKVNEGIWRENKLKIKQLISLLETKI